MRFGRQLLSRGRRGLGWVRFRTFFGWQLFRGSTAAATLDQSASKTLRLPGIIAFLRLVPFLPHTAALRHRGTRVRLPGFALLSLTNFTSLVTPKRAEARAPMRALRCGCVAFVVLFAVVLTGFAASFTASIDRNSIVLGEQVTLTLEFKDG